MFIFAVLAGMPVTQKELKNAAFLWRATLDYNMLFEKAKKQNKKNEWKVSAFIFKW